MQGPDIPFPLLETTAIQRLLQQGCLQVRGQRLLHEVRWNTEVMLIRHRDQPLFCAGQKNGLYAEQLRGRAELFVLLRPLLVHMANQGPLLVTQLAAKLAKRGCRGWLKEDAEVPLRERKSSNVDLT
jgi:hypothetical protein